MSDKDIIIKIKPRNPFRVTYLPTVTKLYKWAMENDGGGMWKALTTRIIYLIFYMLQRFWPFNYSGKFDVDSVNKQVVTVRFNAKNAQFEEIYLDVFKNGYEPEVVALLDTIVTKNDVVYDVGSNWGSLPLFLLSNPNFGGIVYAFEPFPSTFKDLEEVVSQIDNKGRICCLQLALSDNDGVLKMSYPGMLQSGFAQITNTNTGFLKPSAMVNVKKIDSLELKPPTILKIDAQFHENEILKGAIHTLKKSKPIIIIENCLDFFDPTQTIAPLTLLESLGYRLYFPCWQDSTDKLIPSEADMGNYNSNVLVLTPLNIKERFLMRNMINVVAFHKTHEWLRGTFKNKTWK